MINTVKHVFALLALAWAASGQQIVQPLVGLPQYGVSLEGLVDNPSVVNTSGKAILAYTVWFRNAQGRGPLGIILETQDLRHGIVRTGPVPDSGIRSQTNTGPIVEARLDAVAFGDGQFVGVDWGQNFAMLAAIIDAERSLGQGMLDGKISWGQIESWAKERKAYPRNEP
jgi:hypothetical protein